jgi:carboxypeptidase Q
MFDHAHRHLRWAAIGLLSCSIPLFSGPSAPAFFVQEPTPDASAEEAIAEAVERIKDEGLNRSQVMETVSYLCDVIGPRLTGSPGMAHANEWTRETLESWGLQNAEVEPWGTFGRGWSLDRFSMQVVEPQCIPLIAMPKAWSPGTDGPVTGKVVLLELESEEDFEAYEGELEGAIVLLSRERDVPAHFEPQARRHTDDRLLAMANAPAPGEGPRRSAPSNRRRPSEEEAAAARSRAAVAARRDGFLIEQGVALVVDCSTRGDGGTIFVQSASVPRDPDDDSNRRVRPWDTDAPEMLPQVTMAVEHYNRLVRMIKQGVEPVMEVDLAVSFHDEDLTAANTIAEIPGSDPELGEQVVMIGGHLDSWHGSTGATDNAAGCAVAMEAVRILRALDLEPRRTIRIGLWSGEEQGLYGSRNYVSKHLGSRGDGGSLETTDAYDAFAAYYNLDNGTGKIRGVYLQGNEAVRPIFRRWLQPFGELDASTLTASNTGGTDHLAFDGIGLPGFQFIQDPIEYSSRTHHSTMDSYERLQADDLKQAAVIMAAFAYRTAMMDDLLPRKPMDDR